jgi:anti-sigma B factor antagonist
MRSPDARGSTTLELAGELDPAACVEFGSRLAEELRDSRVLTLDLCRLTFMDSAGYAVLLEAARAARPDAELILTGCGGQVMRLLDLIGLPPKVELHPHAVPALARGVATPSQLGLEAPRAGIGHRNPARIGHRQGHPLRRRTETAVAARRGLMEPCGHGFG